MPAMRTLLAARRSPRGFSLVEIIVVLVIVVIALGFLFSARPMRAARRLELMAGHRQILDGRYAGDRLWAFKVDHCRRLARYCKEDEIFRVHVNPDGSRGDQDVLRLEELLDLYDAAANADPPKPTRLLLWPMDSLRTTLEARYLKLQPTHL